MVDKNALSQKLYTPPPYTVRISTRAKRIGLRIRQGSGLEVVLPVGVNPSCVPRVVERHQAWIEKHLGRMGQSPERENKQYGLFTREFFARGGAEYIVLIPHKDDKPGPLFLENGLQGNRPGPYGGLTQPLPQKRFIEMPKGVYASQAIDPVVHWLRGWLREEAYRVLGALVDEVAVTHSFTYKSLRVRFQKTRWGSCSAKQSISLNAALLFLPETLARYIVIHELCHLRHMNHSPLFWKEVFSIDPDALFHDKAMGRAWRFVPDWIFLL